MQAYYEKDNHQNNYENNYTLKRKLSNNDDNSPLTEEKFISKVSSIGDFFCEKIKYNGYTLRSISAIGDVDMICLKEEIFQKIFSLNINKFERQKRNFILRNIPNLCEMSSIRNEVFFSRIDTMVTFNLNFYFRYFIVEK